MDAVPQNLTKAIVSSFLAVASAIMAPGLACLAQDLQAVERARSEGRIVWYTTQIVDQFARPAAQAFEKKYGIRVEYVRADSSVIALRISNEAKAGKTLADVFDGSSTVPYLKKEGLVAQWVPPSASRLPERYVDREKYWVAINEFVFTPAFNSTLVKADEAPSVWADFLNPKWKGKLVWSSQPIASAAPGFIGMMIEEMGEPKALDYLKRLGAQQPVGLKASARLVLDQVISGEYPLAIHTFNHQSVISAAKGAPSVWKSINPGLAVMTVASVTKNAPHPNAARLFVDFLVSKEGQQLFRDNDYIPVDPDVPPRVAALRPDGVKFRAIYMTPEQIENGMSKWMSIYNDIFR
ncbi:MAG: ABC transporter substrate-binding protein [Beijerinckiaceae bacterium]